MIKYIENESLLSQIIDSFENHDTFLTKINSVFKAYGIGVRGIDFWFQQNQNKYTALILKTDGNIVLYLTENTDITELSEFINVIGYSSVLFDNNCNLQLSGSSQSQGIIMKLCEKQTSNKSDSVINICNEDNYKKVYEFFNSINCDDVKINSYGDFATDLFSKVRCGVSKVFSIYEKDKIISCMIATGDKINTIIGPVATSKEFQNCGLGRNLIYSVDDAQNVYLYCNDDEHTQIYRKMGFVPSGEWKEIYR
ncbi:MAG: GNAT family N-acetyltransferase [Oscillospiraceae bacterium]|nr:GNAT family N-acetyltransferase [Oscillospiraceae bacterium]